MAEKKGDASRAVALLMDTMEFRSSNPSILIVVEYCGSLLSLASSARQSNPSFQNATNLLMSDTGVPYSQVSHTSDSSGSVVRSSLAFTESSLSLERRF
jgi:hypothetical protein